MPVFLLDELSYEFPPVELSRPDGLLAVGGDLSVKRLLNAYRSGIFPWYNQGEPILWWSPDPRLVLFPEELHVPRRLKREMRKGRFRITCNRAFRQVMEQCGQTRLWQNQGTWINREMINAYCRLHELGYALSFEAWRDEKLVGGLYGVILGSVFFGESMFHRERDASKVAFVHFVNDFKQRGLRLIDCQVETEHLKRFGARLIPRPRFLELLVRWQKVPLKKGLPGPSPAC